MGATGNTIFFWNLLAPPVSKVEFRFSIWLFLPQERTQELGLGKALPNKDWPVGYSNNVKSGPQVDTCSYYAASSRICHFLRSLLVLYQICKRECCRSNACQQVFFRKLTKQKAGIKPKITHAMPLCDSFLDLMPALLLRIHWREDGSLCRSLCQCVQLVVLVVLLSFSAMYLWTKSRLLLWKSGHQKINQCCKNGQSVLCYL